ncbi:hypothetical protein AB1Y20_022683 [Prymnesium parvum]|uniref:Uncharacterized protein n=1 Tax=Prymnesium parvum TaxID=97485 RepID=A0AB34JGX8_PRYPA
MRRSITPPQPSFDLLQPSESFCAPLTTTHPHPHAAISAFPLCTTASNIIVTSSKASSSASTLYHPFTPRLIPMLPLAPIRPEATRALTPSLIPQVVEGGGSSMGGGGQGRNRPWRDEGSHGKGYGGARYSGGHPDRRHDSIRYSHWRHHPYAGASRRDHWQHDDTRRDAARPAPPSMGNYDGSRGYDRGMSAPRSPANGTPHEVPPPFPSAREADADEEHSLQQPAASMVASPTYSNDSDEDDLDVEQAVGKLRDVLVKLIPFLKEQEKSPAGILCPFTMRGLAHIFKSGHVSQSTYRAMARHFEWPRDPRATLQPQKVKCHAKPMRDLRALHMHACKCSPSIEVTELLEDDETSGDQLCHRVLDEILGPHSLYTRPDMAASYSARKPQEFSETMSWPPVLVLDKCTRDLSSGTLLKAKYSDWGATHFFNEYDARGFTGKAVLCFDCKPGKALADSYEQAKLLKENLSSQRVAEVGSVRWLTKTEMDTWSRTPKSWANKFYEWAKHVDLDFVNKADHEEGLRQAAQLKMEQVERIAYQSSHEAAARMREIEEAKTKTNSIRLGYEKKVAEMEADFMKNLSEQEARSKLFEQKLKQLDEQAKGERELMRKVQERSKREQAALKKEMEEKLRRVTQQEAEECRNEYEQKIREKEQSLQDKNIQYQEMLARLKEERDKANLEAEQIKQEAEEAKEDAVHVTKIHLESTRVMPLNHLFLRVQGLLFRDFSDELDRGHFIRSVGLVDVGYMQHLGLSVSDAEMAVHMWIGNFLRHGNAEPEDESGLPLFEPYKIFPIYKDPENGDRSYQVKEDHPFVVAFRKRYKKKNPLTQRTQAAEMLEYMKVMFSEYQNSQPPADGYQRVITNCCQLVQCYKEGRCSGKFPQGTFLTPRLYRDDPNAFCHPVDHVVCTPEQHFDLWLQLTQRTG